MIVLAVAILASRPVWTHLDQVGAVSPATLLVGATVAYYLRLHLGYGLVMGALLAGAHVVGQAVAAGEPGERAFRFHSGGFGVPKSTQTNSSIRASRTT